MNDKVFYVSTLELWGSIKALERTDESKGKTQSSKVTVYITFLQTFSQITSMFEGHSINNILQKRSMRVLRRKLQSISFSLAISCYIPMRIVSFSNELYIVSRRAKSLMNQKCLIYKFHCIDSQELFSIAFSNWLHRLKLYTVP